MRYKNALAPDFAESSPILKMACHLGWMPLSLVKPEDSTFRMMRLGLCMVMLPH
jgi:hypothetical protein